VTGHTRTQLWTPDGYRNVEDIEVGDLVFSRSEYDPAGLIVAKPVEERFVRTGRILHLHFPGGELIRTTPEHPFYVHSRGWVAAGELAAGDWVLTEAGEWKKVSDVFDTGEYEVVYNLRVADFHTYFVGGDGWGWAVWAHNAYLTVYRYPAPGMPDETKHWSIRITTDDNPVKSNHTHMILTAFPQNLGSLQDWLAWNADAQIEQTGTGSKAEASKVLSVDNTLATAAYNYAESRLTSGTVKYDLAGRSCFTYVAQVLNKAGYNLAIPGKGDVGGMNTLLSGLNSLIQ